MKIGFSKKVISPPKGILLAGYGGKPRHNIGVHDDLFCRVVVLENKAEIYVLLVLDIMSMDESLANLISSKLHDELGINKDNIISASIHTHSGPSGVILSCGELKDLNNIDSNKGAEKLSWLKDTVVPKCLEVTKDALKSLDTFKYRFISTKLPKVGSERHDGSVPKGKLNMFEFVTSSNKSLLIYNFPCHPTVMNASNLYVSADFIGHVEPKLNYDMCMFVNGPAGDVSTRFIRKSSSFDECNRLADILVRSIKKGLAGKQLTTAEQFKFKHMNVELDFRHLDCVYECKQKCVKAKKYYEKALLDCKSCSELRVIKSQWEGAQLNLHFSELLRGKNIKILHLPLTFAKFDDIDIVSVPGELFSALMCRQDIVYICYANGYYRYIPNKKAFDKCYYEALGSIINNGEGEKLIDIIEKELENCFL